MSNIKVAVPTQVAQQLVVWAILRTASVPNQTADAGAVEISILVEVDRPLVAEQLRTAGEEFALAELGQAPNRHAADLWVGMFYGGVDFGSDGGEMINRCGAEAPDGPKDAGTEMIEVFGGHVRQQRDDDGGVVGKQGGPAANDFRHGLWGVAADAARLLADQPVEATQVFADSLGIMFGNAIRGHTHGLHGAPPDLRINIERQRNEDSQGAFLSRRHVGDPFESPLVE